MNAFVWRIAALLLAITSGTLQAQADLKLDVPYGPTSYTTVDAMLRIAHVSARDFVIDLGSGDGRINIAAARDFSAAGIGFDLDPELIKLSHRNARLAGVEKRVEFREENLFDADLSRASVVTLYLGPEVTPRVAPKLLSQLKPGARLVSHHFRFSDWPPDLVVNGREHGAVVYFWWVPAKVAGIWRSSTLGSSASEPAPQYVLDVRQHYQALDGDARIEASNTRITLRDARLEGTRLQFWLQEQRNSDFSFKRFSGRVEGDTMIGHFRTEDSPSEIPVRFTRSVRAEPGPAGAWNYRR